MSMVHRVYSPQDLTRRRAIKLALRSLSEGHYGMSRGEIADALGVSRATYWRWTDDGHSELPDLLELAKIVSLTNNAAPLAALAQTCGDGYQVQPSGSARQEPDSTELWELLLVNSKTGSAAQVGLLEALEDRVLTADEARRLVPLLRASINARQMALDVALRVVEGTV